MATLNQTDYSKIQDNIRNDFILEKDRAIQNVLTTYYGSMRYIIERFLSSKNSVVPELTDNLIRELLSAIGETEPVITNTFAGEIGRMFDVGLDSVLTPLVYFDRNTAPFVQSFQVRKNGTIKSLIEDRGVSNLSISENIWNPVQTTDIFGIIRKGLQQGNNPFEIAQQLENYSMNGDGFYNAYRLAYTELTHANSLTQIEAIRDWNQLGDFKILIEQYLSPMHRQYCICDILQGFYDPDKPVPKIPRHPNCNCGQRQYISTEAIQKKVTTIGQKLQAAEYKAEILHDIRPTAVNPSGVVRSSTNPYNAKFEQITQNLKGSEQKVALQELQDSIDLNDPVGKTVSNMLEKYYGIKRYNIGTDVLDATQKDFLQRAGVEVTDKPFDPADKASAGSFDLQNNRLYINPTIPAAEQKNTILHEFAHAIDSNLDRVNKKLLSDQKAFNDIIREPDGSLTKEGAYIIVKRALGMSGTDGLKLQQWIIKNTPLSEIDEKYRSYVLTFRDYFESKPELFAEGYMLFKTDPNFIELAPNLYNYYTNLDLTSV